MAASGYTPIQIYHSTTVSAAPTAGNLVNGELAINILDGKLYYKDNGGVVQVIATKGTGTIGGSTTQVQYNNTGALAGSANFTFDGTTATINTLNLTNALGAAYGGTAQSTYAQGDLLYASAANTLAKLPIGISTYILTSNGTIPGWSIPSSVVIGTATNLAGGAAGSVPYQSGAGVTTFLSIGTVNQVVTSTGSAPQWSSGLSITTLTASDAVTFSATTQNIALGTSQTSGTFTVGGAAQTGTQTIDQSTKTHTLNIGAGATESGATKTVNLATAGVSGSTTTMSVGSAVSGAITNLTVNATTTLAPVARSTGAVSYFTVTTPADTGLTASTEVIGSSFTAATRTWATGALTLQRERVFAAPTYAFAGASTLTTAVNVDIGLPVAGTNATITNAYALRADNTLFTGNVVLNNASAALDLTNLEVTNIKAKDGTASMTLADTTGIITLSATAGTANGVAYLNGSRALTTGSALTFDGSTLTNTRNTTDGSAAALTLNNSGATASYATLNLNAGSVTYQQFADAAGNAIGTAGVMFRTTSNHPLLWGINNSEQMRLTSTGLGIGTSSPAGKLHVAGQAQIQDSANAANYIVIGSGANAPRGGNSVMAQTGSMVMGTEAASNLIFITNAAEAARLDSSGNLGLGVTPSAWGTYKAIQVNSLGISGSTGDGGISFNGYYDGSNWKYIGTGQATLYNQYQGQHRFFTSTSGSAGGTISLSQAMTLDASGNLLVGDTSNPGGRFYMKGGYARFSDGTYTGLFGKGSDLVVGGGASDLAVRSDAAILFSVGSAEKARITSGGYFKASDSGVYVSSTSYHELVQSAANTTAYFANTNATAANNYGINISYRNADPNGTGNHFIYCEGNGVTERMSVRSNGGIANYQANDANLSDQRVKKDIVAAPSYWDKIKGIEIVHFKYKDQTHDDNNVGVIAQQVEQVAPEFVDQNGWGDTPEDGVPLKSIYTSDMYHAAIKALQEAMARIEKLEAEVAALKGA